MPETYTHLTEEQRYQIYEGLIEKQSHRAIAKRIGKHHGSVSREVARNVGLKGYRPRQADISAVQRKEEKPKRIKLTPKVQAIIRKHIGEEWSPEQIQGRLKNDGNEMVCPATIYRFIKLDEAAGGELYKNLRHKKL